MAAHAPTLGCRGSQCSDDAECTTTIRSTNEHFACLLTFLIDGRKLTGVRFPVCFLFVVVVVYVLLREKLRVTKMSEEKENQGSVLG